MQLVYSNGLNFFFLDFGSWYFQCALCVCARYAQKQKANNLRKRIESLRMACNNVNVGEKVRYLCIKILVLSARLCARLVYARERERASEKDRQNFCRKEYGWEKDRTSERPNLWTIDDDDGDGEDDTALCAAHDWT